MLEWLPADNPTKFLSDSNRKGSQEGKEIKTIVKIKNLMFNSKHKLKLWGGFYPEFELRRRESGNKQKLGFEQNLNHAIFSSLKPCNSWDPLGLSLVDDLSLTDYYGGVFNFEFSADGKTLLAACEKGIVVFDPNQRKQVHNIANAHTSFVNGIRFLDSRLFATCSDDKTVALWDIRNLGKKIKKLEGHRSWVKNIEYSAVDGLLVTSGFDGRILGWNINRFNETEIEYNELLNVRGLMRTRLTPDLSKLVICTTNGYLMVVHDLDLVHLAEDLKNFKPRLYHLMQTSANVHTVDSLKDDYDRIMVASRNRVEFISDFPEKNRAEIVHSLQVHPHGWCVLSRNTSYSDVSEWTCVHDIQNLKREDEYEAERNRLEEKISVKLFADFEKQVTPSPPKFESNEECDSAEESENNNSDIRIDTYRNSSDSEEEDNGMDPRSASTPQLQSISFFNDPIEDSHETGEDSESGRRLWGDWRIENRSNRRISRNHYFERERNEIFERERQWVRRSSRIRDMGRSNSERENSSDRNDISLERTASSDNRSSRRIRFNRRLVNRIDIPLPNWALRNNNNDDENESESITSGWDRRARSRAEIRSLFALRRNVPPTRTSTESDRNLSNQFLSWLQNDSNRERRWWLESSRNFEDPNETIFRPRLRRRIVAPRSNDDFIVIDASSPDALILPLSVGLRSRNIFSGQNSSNSSSIPGCNRRLTHYIEEPNLVKGFIKELCFNSDGRLICSPFDKGIRLMSFDNKCSELSHCVQDTPQRLHVLSTTMCHSSGVVSTKFAPHDCLLVSGCLMGKVVWHQPVL